MVFISSIGGLQPAMQVHITSHLSLDLTILFFAKLGAIDCHAKAHLHKQYFVQFL